MGTIKNKNLIKYSLHISILLIIVGSLVYAVSYYMGFPLRGGIISKLVNIGVVFIIFLLALLVVVSTKKYINFLPTSIFITLIFFSLIISILRNSIVEYIPTLLRFLSYFSIFYIGYLYRINLGYDKTIKLLKVFVWLNIAICISFSFLEFALNDIQYLNSAYRLAGPFKGHQLAFALYLFVLIIIFNELYLFKSKSALKNLISLLISSALIFLLVMTHSRALMVILVLVYFAYYFIRIKSVSSFLKVFLLIFIACFTIYNVIVYTDVSPRLRRLIVSENAFNDPSTLERFDIIEKSISHASKLDLVIGVGLGGFNQFYYEATGLLGKAAHNNYLLFLIEGVAFGLLLYLLFQISFILYLIKTSRKSISSLTKISFLLFLGVEILSFLLNNYYFYCSELVVWILLGFNIANNRVQAKID